MSYDPYNQAESSGSDDRGGEARGDRPMSGGPMSDRCPINQPPNSRDLERYPPASPDCARVRGWVRDFADGDLEPAACRALEEHVHRCRNCAIELVRAEHEVLRLRKAFTAIGADEPGVPPNLARRIVQRLVLDETSMLSAAALADAAAEAERREALTDGRRGDEDRGDEMVDSESSVARRARSANSRRSNLAGSRAEWFRRSSGSAMLSPAAQLVTVLLLLVGLGICFAVFDDHDGLPEHSARLVVREADGAFHNGTRLSPGQGLGNDQGLYVVRGGDALVEWQDLTSLAQPAALLHISGDGNVQLHNGEPQLLNGRAEVTANRPMSIAMNDGSQIDLGVGQYVIDAEVLVDLDRGSQNGVDENGLRDAPAGLRVKVEVLRGDAANVVRIVGQSLVQAGQVGVYQGGGRVVVGSSGGLVAQTDGIGESRKLVPEDLPTAAFLSGSVIEASGQPGVGTQVVMSFSVNDAPKIQSKPTGSDGVFLFRNEAPCDGTFAIVMAAPPAVRQDLGIIPPQAMPLTRQGLDSQLSSPIQLGVSAPLAGIVNDDLGEPRQGVQVVPCVFDEIFGRVLTLVNERVFTDALGRFTLYRMPARLPKHEALLLLLVHPDLETVVVPVPMRGQISASDPLAPMVAPRLHAVAFHELPFNTNVEIVQEIPGLPPSSAAWRRSAHTDSQGRIDSMQVGSGQMWLRVSYPPGHPWVKKLAQDEAAGIPRYHPTTIGQYTDMAAEFGPLQLIPDSSLDPSRRLEVVNSYRHQTYELGSPSGNGPAVRVFDAGSASVAAGQVFAIEPTGPRGTAQLRFLGFTSLQGIASIESVTPSESLVVIGPDGAVGFSDTSVSPGEVHVQATGRVLLPQSLRPPLSSPYRVVTIRFERVSDELPAGLSQVAYRFASDSTLWTVDDLPAGHYNVFLNGDEHHVTLPPGGYVVLQ